MLSPRLIPILLLSDGGIVKGRSFTDHIYVGDPINIVRIFNEKEVDELIILDIDASRNDTEPDLMLLSDIVTNCFMPVAYGGGICSLDRARRVLALGVEKLCLQTAVYEDLGLVRDLSTTYGSQAIVASVDVVQVGGKPSLYSAAHGTTRDGDWRALVGDAVAAGAGEVLLTSVDREGWMTGLDLELIRDATEDLEVPLIAHGGVGSVDDVLSGLAAGADAVAAGSFLVFSGPHRAVLITYPQIDPDASPAS